MKVKGGQDFKKGMINTVIDSQEIKEDDNGVETLRASQDASGGLGESSFSGGQKSDLRESRMKWRRVV